MESDDVEHMKGKIKEEEEEKKEDEKRKRVTYAVLN
jgi:hypothetical protein